MYAAICAALVCSFVEGAAAERLVARWRGRLEKARQGAATEPLLGAATAKAKAEEEEVRRCPSRPALGLGLGACWGRGWNGWGPGWLSCLGLQEGVPLLVLCMLRAGAPPNYAHRSACPHLLSLPSPATCRATTPRCWRW